MRVAQVITAILATLAASAPPLFSIGQTYPIASPRHSGAARARRESKQRRRAK